jgi:hypothetical protein
LADKPLLPPPLLLLLLSTTLSTYLLSISCRVFARDNLAL